MTDNIFSMNTTINVNNAGFDGRLTVAGAMSLFQYAVTLHTDAMGIGYDDVLNKHGAKWVIAKARFEIDSLPRNGQAVTVVTWPLKPGIMRFGRCFELLDSSGKSCINAYTDWCIIDKDSFEVLRTDRLGQLLPQYLTTRHVKKYSNFSLELSETDFCYKKVIRLSDLDINGHVNNISYIKMAMDCFTCSEAEKLNISSFEMNFKRQCFEGDTFSLYRKGDGQGYYIEAADSSGIKIFTASINK